MYKMCQMYALILFSISSSKRILMVGLSSDWNIRERVARRVCARAPKTPVLRAESRREDVRPPARGGPQSGSNPGRDRANDTPPRRLHVCWPRTRAPTHTSTHARPRRETKPPAMDHHWNSHPGTHQLKSHHSACAHCNKRKRCW